MRDLLRSEMVIAEYLSTICGYNGYMPAIKELRAMMENPPEKDGYGSSFTLLTWYEITKEGEFTYYGGQLEMIWMFLVLMYGEYGVSPRAGWIEDEKIPECKLFLDRMIELEGYEDEDE